MTRHAWFVAVLVAAGCGSGGGSGATAEQRMAAYQALGQQVSGELTTYAGETASLPDTATCEDAEQRHESAMDGMLTRMEGMSGWMDAHMPAATPADLECMVAAMQAQMAYHHTHACTAADPAGQEAEAAGHHCIMSAFMDHQRVRYEQCGEHLGMMGGASGETFTCVDDGDGTFTINGQPWTPGTTPSGVTCEDHPDDWPMPCTDGGMMGCDDHHGGMGGGGMGGMP
ncbi:MAG: hypothetical protein QM767_14520 [Anaeromyxobacter sp.]